jgi:hypothetical protein
VIDHPLMAGVYCFAMDDERSQIYHDTFWDLMNNHPEVSAAFKRAAFNWDALPADQRDICLKADREARFQDIIQYRHHVNCPTCKGGVIDIAEKECPFCEHFCEDEEIRELVLRQHST